MLQLLVLSRSEAGYFNSYIIFDGGVYLPSYHTRVRDTWSVKYIQVDHHLRINIIEENLPGIPVGKNFNVPPHHRGYLVVLETYNTTVTKSYPLASFKIQAEIIANRFGSFICLQSLFMASSGGHSSSLHYKSGIKIRDNSTGPVPTSV